MEFRLRKRKINDIKEHSISKPNSEVSTLGEGKQHYEKSYGSQQPNEKKPIPLWHEGFALQILPEIAKNDDQ